MTDSAPAETPRGPLHGVRVLDLTRVLAGPFCTTMLWELGAEVLKIERPGHGDDTRAFPPFLNGESVYFASVNRGKRSIALDLNAAPDRETFEQLLRKADVLVENFRPGTMERLGYDWETLKSFAPSLIYARISGFGQTGPYRDRPAYDLIVQALGGMISINGPESSHGYRLGISLADTGAGLFAALAIASDPDSQVLGLVAHAWAGFGAAFGPLMLLALMWDRMTGAGAVAGLVTGAGVVATWIALGWDRRLPGLDEGLYEIVPGFAAAWIAIVAVSRMTKPAPPQAA